MTTKNSFLKELKSKDLSDISEEQEKEYKKMFVDSFMDFQERIVEQLKIANDKKNLYEKEIITKQDIENYTPMLNIQKLSLENEFNDVFKDNKIFSEDNIKYLEDKVKSLNKYNDFFNSVSFDEKALIKDDYIDDTIYKARQESKSFNDYVNNENLYSGNSNLELYNKVDFKFNEDGTIKDILKDGVSFKDIDSIALNVPNDGLKESLLNKVSNEAYEDLRTIYNIEEQSKARIEEIANKLNSNDFDDFVNDNFDGSFTNVLAKLDINKDDLGNILDVKNDGVSFKNNDNKSIENDREI